MTTKNEAKNSIFIHDKRRKDKRSKSISKQRTISYIEAGKV